MKVNARAIVLLALLSGVLNSAVEAAICPGCQTVLTPTLSERYSRADAAALAKWVSATPASEDGKTAAKTVLKILQIARNPDKLLKADATITLPKYYNGDAETVLFVTGSRIIGKEKSPIPIQWDDPTDMSEAAYFYVLQAPSPEVAGPKRLKYFLRFFEFPDLTVADDAYNEFAKAPFKDVKAAADAFPREKLRKWLTDPKTPPTHIGLYGIMLGLCGKKDDIPLMEKKIIHTKDEFRMGIEGIIAGYLMLVGDKGMDFIDRTKLADEKVPFGEMYMAVQGMRIVWTYAEERVQHDRLKQSMRKLLDRPKSAELILADLARWQDWAVMNRVAKLYGTKDYSSRAYKIAALQYLIAATKDLPSDSKAKPGAHVAVAKAHLDVLKKKDPPLYRAALQMVF